MHPASLNYWMAELKNSLKEFKKRYHEEDNSAGLLFISY